MSNSMTDEAIEAMARAILRKRVGMGDAEGVIASVIANHEASQTWDWLDALADAKAASEAVALLLQPPVSAAPEGWRPIETAPGTGVPIIVFDPREDGHAQISIRGADGYFWRRERVGPTHWRPLPTPPAESPKG